MNALMKKSLAAAGAVLAAGLLASCETPKVTAEEMESVNYGPAPVHWKEEIRGYLDLRLRAPKEAMVDFRTEPKKFFQRQVALDPQVHGWAVCVWIRDKNKQGTFDKMYPMVAFLRNEKIVAVNNGPDNFGPSGPIYAKQQCKELGAPFPED